ncbi:MAG TPA: flagellar basal body P-ring formation chaperone FlgA, partial [Arenibaculum sp.]|nr:flagellar basal body P-ring formation chaperone FlgA [Arenibaculum sp.]
VLAEAIAARVPEGRVELEVDNRLMEVHLPAGETPDAAPVLVVETLDHDRSHGRFSATVLARTPTGEARFPVSGRALAVVDLPVLNRTIRSGEVIGDADITWIEQRMTRNADRAVRDAADLVGMSPRRTLPPNAPVHPRDLRQPSLVARGSLVTMVLESRSMTLTAQGRALQDGADGDVVRVVNTMSNRTIEATVAGPGLVAVSRPSTAAQF